MTIQTIRNQDGEIIGTEHIYGDENYSDPYDDQYEDRYMDEEVDPATCQHMNGTGEGFNEDFLTVWMCDDCEAVIGFTYEAFDDRRGFYTPPFPGIPRC